MRDQYLNPNTIISLDKLCDTIMGILNEVEGGEIHLDCNTSLVYTYRMELRDPRDDHQTRLGMKYFAPQRLLIIQNVLFENRRQGTMTKILDLIKERSKECNINKIIIESVISPDMAHCALKNGFHIEESSGGYIEVSSFFDENSPKETIFGGNYVYDIKEE